MLTLLPYRDYVMTAEILRDQDLENQVIHTLLILDTLHETDDLVVRAWHRHPVIAMWKGYETQLCLYGEILVNELNGRGVGLLPEAGDRMKWHYDTATMPDDFKMEKPPWMVDDLKMHEVELSHRSILVARDSYYQKLWPTAIPGQDPYWPRASGE